MFKKKALITILILIILLATFFYKFNFKREKISQTQNAQVENFKEDELLIKNNEQIEKIEEEKKSEISTKKTKKKVPFVVQAPFAKWSEDVFQDGCEEASIVMAMGWVNGEEKITAQDSEKRILEIVKYEDKNLGFNASTDLGLVEKIFKQYYGYQKVDLKSNIAIQDIKNELAAGNIVLVPAFGRALGNPNFTAPGPIAHMLVIVGFDHNKGEFITNDPGTRKGEGFQYKEKVLFDAIWQYPSGERSMDLPQKENINKRMLIVNPR